MEWPRSGIFEAHRTLLVDVHHVHYYNSTIVVIAITETWQQTTHVVFPAYGRYHFKPLFQFFFNFVNVLTNKNSGKITKTSCVFLKTNIAITVPSSIAVFASFRPDRCPQFQFPLLYITSTIAHCLYTSSPVILLFQYTFNFLLPTNIAEGPKPDGNPKINYF